MRKGRQEEAYAVKRCERTLHCVPQVEGCDFTSTRRPKRVVGDRPVACKYPAVRGLMATGTDEQAPPTNAQTSRPAWCEQLW